MILTAVADTTDPAGRRLTAPRLRAALFALVGVTFATLWVSFRSTYDEQSSFDLNLVVGFSAALALLAAALPAFAHMVGASIVVHVSLIPAAGAAIGSVANLVEDGLRVEEAFWGFVAGAALMTLGLIALAAVIARAVRGRRRLLAAIPLGTMAAITFYPTVGGAVMLATWAGAAVLALRGYGSDREPAAG